MLASPPDAVNKGLFPVAPFANVISFTALAVAVKMNNSFPLASLRLVVIRGEVALKLSEPAVTFVPSLVKPVIPPNDDELLY